MDAIDFNNVKNVEKLLDTYLKSIKDINKIYKIVMSKHPDFPLNIKEDQNFTIILLNALKAFEPLSKNNISCFENYSETNVISYFSILIYNLEHGIEEYNLFNGKTEDNEVIVNVDSKDIDRLKNKLNEIYRYISDNFNPFALYKEVVYFSRKHGHINYITQGNIINSMKKSKYKYPTGIASSESVTQAIEFNSEEEIIDFMKIPLDTNDRDLEKATKTNILISYLNGNISNKPVKYWKILKEYNDEFVRWIKSDEKARENRFEYPLIYGTDFSLFLIHIYIEVEMMGNSDTYIDSYRKSIETIEDGEVVKSANEQIEDIRKTRYFATSMFMNALSNEKLVAKIIPINLILFVLSRTPDPNADAYQIHSCFKALFLKADFVTYHFNPFYVHFTPKDEADSRDIFIARVLSILMNFNSMTIEIQCPAYNVDLIDEIKLYCASSYSRYLRSTNQMIKSLYLRPDLKLDKESEEFKTYVYDSEELISRLEVIKDKLENRFEEIKNIKKEETDESDGTYQGIEDSIENVNLEIDRLNKAKDRFENISTQFDVLCNNVIKLNAVGIEYTDELNIEDFEKGELGKLIWPERIIHYVPIVSEDSEEYKPYDPDSKENFTRHLKPGDIIKHNRLGDDMFKPVPDSSHKDGCF